MSETEVAAAIRAYAASARTHLAGDEAQAVSYAGLWLLLASYAPVVTDAAAFRSVFGLTPEQAKEAANRLLAEPHPTVAAALGGWLRPGVALGGELPVALDALPSQEALDRWAAERTRGLINSFPIKLDPLTLLVLASALVLTPRWSGGVDHDDADDMLVVSSGLRAVVQTSVGPVAVASPATEDAVDVISVIAAPGVAPAQVWTAVDEVLVALSAGQVRSNSFPSGMPPGEVEQGHAWTSVEFERRFWGDAPEDGSDVWEARVPEWSATTAIDLVSAPGVDLIAAPIQAMLPEGSDVTCVQKVTARYDDEGFSAAAVTAMAFAARGAPAPKFRRIREVTLTFDRPHAVIAVARGGVWDEVPLFQAWVDPKDRVRYLAAH